MCWIKIEEDEQEQYSVPQCAIAWLTKPCEKLNEQGEPDETWNTDYDYE